MEKTRYELKRIGVFSAVKTCFLLGGVMGFLLGLIQWALLGMLWWAGQNSPFSGGLPNQYRFDDVVGGMIGAIGLFFPLIGAFAGAVGGVALGFTLAATYNLGARFWGGFELDWQVIVPPASLVAASAPQSQLRTPLPTFGGGTALPIAPQSGRAPEPAPPESPASTDRPGASHLYE